MSDTIPTINDPFVLPLFPDRPIPEGDHPEVSTPTQCRVDRERFGKVTKVEKKR